MGHFQGKLPTMGLLGRCCCEGDSPTVIPPIECADCATRYPRCMSGNLYGSRNCGGIKGDLRQYIEAPWLWKVPTPCWSLADALHNFCLRPGVQGARSDLP